MTHAVLVDTPWRVGSSAAETFNYTMASKADPKRSKRNLPDDDSDSETELNTWPRFIVLESGDISKPLKINPFALSKAIQGVAGSVKSVKKMSNGSYLVECANKAQSDNLLRTTKLATVDVSTFPHKSLNYSKGIIRDRARVLAEMTEFELSASLKSQGVASVKRFTYKRNNETLPSNTYLLNFTLPKPPSSVKAGYFSIPIEAYIPSPFKMLQMP